MAASTPPENLSSPDPALLRILHYPEPVLLRKAEHVPPADAATAAVAQRMIELMIEAPGIGLAAPQVGLPWRLFVAHVPPPPPEGAPDYAPPDLDIPLFHPEAETVQIHSREPEVFIDPVITAFSRDLEPSEEGCLSLPHITGVVRRPSLIMLTATTIDGERVKRTAMGLLGRCWQHEIDHLDGVLITTKFGMLDRRRAKRQLDELEARVRKV